MTATPVTNPTWYAQIRDMFTSVDRAHMARQGLDLASYDAVMNHAGDIYQQVAAGNMPPGNPWPADWVGTFLNWMNNGYPKGVPVTQASQADFAARSLFSTAAPAGRMRKDITTLSSNELDQLKKLFPPLRPSIPLTRTAISSRRAITGFRRPIPIACTTYRATTHGTGPIWSASKMP